MVSLFNEIKTYLETKYKIVRLDITEKIIVLISLIIQIIIIALFSFLILFVLSLALGSYLGTYWDNTGLGFLAVTGFYIIILLIFIIFRKTFIIKPVSKMFINLFLKLQEEDNDDEE